MVKKSSYEKINSKQDLPKVKDAPIIWGGGSMAIPNPIDIKKIIDMIPMGEIMTLNAIRDQLSVEYGTDITCPMTTAIFINLIAKSYDEGDITSPYWRVVKNKGELNSKFPGGIEGHLNFLVSEGITVQEIKGKYYAKI
ncbi:MAG: hypothetical protein FI695_05495 [SAR202 cluster bacterium]|nr:hypothetical protein [SAR202 cluster bacterium]|tara:strand:+ start:855 stop:1271 length:417 start_codon:yes stop_codon:yes gene_type:complete